MLVSQVASLLALLAPAAAKNVSLDWTLSWKTVNPDGLADRMVVAINDEWPLPVLNVSKGDRIMAKVYNNLTSPSRNSSIHWHGMFQNGTSDMDGPSWVTQCPTGPGTTFYYNFEINQNGTYWYHAHVDNLYPDGYRQILLVNDDEPPFESDEDISFTLSDWYHELTQIIAEDDFMSLYNPTGAEPVPKALLFNDTTNPKFDVRPNTTYRLRIANTAAFSAFYFYMPGHNFTIVEADGVYTEETEASVILVAVGQRYSILFTTGADTNTSYPMVQIADSALYDLIPADLVLNQTAWLVTDPSAECTEITNEDIYNDLITDGASLEDFTSDDIEWFDDATLIPYDHMPLLPDPDQTFTVQVVMNNLLDGVNYAFFNGITYTHAKVPTLYTVLSAPDTVDVANSTIYGTDTHPEVLDYMNVVELVLNNFDGGAHPFHLHGHTFQVLLRAESKGSDDDSDYFPYDPSVNVTFPEYPMRRDVLVVKPYSHFVIRWVADNPGVWFFHCHIDWHLTQGLAMTFIEAPNELRERLTVNQANYDACTASGLPYEGNAAANTEDFYNLSGQNVQEANLPDGFTARGIVALVFSIICAFVGMGFLTWYGLSETPETEAREAERILHEHVDPADVELHREGLHDIDR